MHTTRIAPFVLAVLVSACASVNEQTSEAPAPQSAGSAPAPSVRPVPAPARPGSLTTTARMGAPGKASVYFDYDRDEIKPEFRGVVEDHAKFLRENPAVKIRIEGNADERGSREYNLALGQRRAEVVMKALGLLGVPAGRMEAVSYGEEKPRRTGHDEAAWAENRRDDIVLEAGR